MVEFYPISSRDQSRLHQFGKKVSPGIFLGYALIAGEFGKKIFWSQTFEELEKMDASEVHRRDHEFREPTLRREKLVRSEDLSEELQGNWGRSHPTETKDDAEAQKDVWSIQGDFI